MNKKLIFLCTAVLALASSCIKTKKLDPSDSAPASETSESTPAESTPSESTPSESTPAGSEEESEEQPGESEASEGHESEPGHESEEESTPAESEPGHESEEESTPAESEPGEESEPVETGYTVQFGTRDAMNLVEGELSADEVKAGALAKYQIEGINVYAGEAIEFKFKDVAFQPGSDMEDELNKNNINGEWPSFTVHNDASGVGLYLKMWDEGYSFWLTGYVAGEGGESEPGEESEPAQEVVYKIVGLGDDWNFAHGVELIEASDEENPNQVHAEFPVSEGDAFKVTDGDELWAGYDQFENGVTGFTTDEDRNIVVTGDGMVDLYYKYVANEIWATFTPEQEGESEGHESEAESGSEAEEGVYTVKFGTAAAIELVEADLDEDEEEAGALAKYKAEGLTLHAGDAIAFALDGEAIAPGSDPEDALNKNNISGTYPNYTVHNDALNAGLYLKVWSDGYSFWLTGYEAAEEESEESGSEAPAMPTSGYGLYFSESKYAVGVHQEDKDYGGRDQYLISNLSFKAGETFSLYNFAEKAAWVIAIDSYSFGAAGDADKVALYVTKGESKYTVVQDFTADVYIKLKYQDDQIYFGLK